ncbi:CBM_HP2_G0039360.mRNA.1.CDS.1 [Saccharomyces cerevisiae]|nr:CBM_HP2_G0039360.mRNA.1.CDS.1 [Saccharomyces cerevisiae]CAI6681937.1 CBM_HP2_G0039360.mRNA.1.CDS.1 [Saccharomyces cerevisiae]
MLPRKRDERIHLTVQSICNLSILAYLYSAPLYFRNICPGLNLFLYLRCRNIILLGSDYCLHIYSEGLMSKIFKLIKRTYFTLARLM